MNEIPDDVAKLVDWLPKRRYTELYGEPASTIDSRIQRKDWVDGVHYSRPKGGGLWISIKAVNAWASAGRRSPATEGSQPPSGTAPPDGS